MMGCQAIALSSNNMVLGTGNIVWKTPSSPSVVPAPASFQPLAINSSGEIVGVVAPYGQGDYYTITNGQAQDLGFSSQPVFLGGYTNYATIDDTGRIAAQTGATISYAGITGASQGPRGFILGSLNTKGLLPGSTSNTAGDVTKRAAQTLCIDQRARWLRIKDVSQTVPLGNYP